MSRAFLLMRQITTPLTWRVKQGHRASQRLFLEWRASGRQVPNRIHRLGYAVEGHGCTAGSLNWSHRLLERPRWSNSRLSDPTSVPTSLKPNTNISTQFTRPLDHCNTPSIKSFLFISSFFKISCNRTHFSPSGFSSATSFSPSSFGASSSTGICNHLHSLRGPRRIKRLPPL